MRKDHHELEFLPAALELEETPASPAGRMMIWVIISLFSSGIAWAAIGEVDIVTVAKGKIIPNGYVKQIQPVEIGTISAIQVQEGQAVTKGEILVELDDRSARADELRLSEEKMRLEKDIQRIQILLDGIIHTAGQDSLLSRLDPLGKAQWQEYVDSRQSHISNRNKIAAEQKTLQAQIEKYLELLPILSKKTQKYKKLSDRKLLAEQNYIDVEQQRIELAHELKTLQVKTDENRAAIRESEDRLEQFTSEFTRTLYQGLDEYKRRKHALEQELVKAHKRRQLFKLRAPVDGVIQQLAIHTIGGVVTPAQLLMTVVPEQNRLEVEAFIENKDIGFVHKEQSVEVKIDAFPFTRYGVIDGKIIHLSKDSITDDKMGLVYKARIALNSNQMNIDGKPIPLSSGMTVSAEARTGKRRLIEYFLSPLLRYKAESVRER